MDYKLTNNNKIGLLLLSIGIILIMGLFTLSSWSDLEALGYKKVYSEESQTNAFRCPVFITTDEDSYLSIKIKNPVDKVSIVRILTFVTYGSSTFDHKEWTILELDPYESHVVSTPIHPKDAAYDKLILAKVIIDNPYPIADQQGFCGVVLVNINFLTGNQLTAVLFTSGLIFIVSGFVLYTTGHRPFRGKFNQRLIIYYVFTAMIIFGTTISIIGYWLFGFLFYLISVIAILTLLFGDRELSITY